jgi:hypothetical protein
MRWTGHVGRIGKKGNAYRIWTVKPEGKRPLGTHSCRWEDVTRWSDHRQFWIGNRIYLTFILVSTNNSDSLTQVHTPNIAVTTAHTKSSHSELAVAW